MLAVGLVGVTLAAALFWLLLVPWLRARRYRGLAERPLTHDMRRLLGKHLPLYAHLSALQKRVLQGQVQIFLADKTFYGCAGQVVDDRIRLTIAGHACLLCLQPKMPCFPAVQSILVYPSAFYVHHDTPNDLGLVSDQPALLAGEAWNVGRVILSWEDVQAATRGAPHNVVVHEFAHQLDFENPRASGASLMNEYSEWAQVFSREFTQLRAHGSPVLDFYGTTNPAEFFAVATETFIQRGADLAQHHADLYRLLSAYYGLNTAL